ncbi:hypothetical protein K1719_010139 [Acacia pycnantha]|nr:hypothetical protein K1719_010139 [Acacia pycnantha]
MDHVGGYGGAGGPGGGGTSCRSSSCCDMTVKCSCRWRLEPHHHFYNRLFSSGFVFFSACLVLFGSIATLYGWVTFTPSSFRTGLSTSGCQEDNEGSWSIGIFFGDSPFSLKPIEAVNVWKNETAAWPVANPIVTCASLSDAGFQSNFVADPFLYIQGGTFYLFYETKNSITLQGDIGVAKSTDKGVTWQQLGIALNEDWPLSHPYVFEYLGQIYMMPDSIKKGELRVYRALNFPLQWKLEKVIMKKPLVDSSIINYDGKYWLFGSDHSGFGNGQLEIWHSSSPLGPWIPHQKSPINNIDRSVGVRNGGRPFFYRGNLFRIGQEAYGRRVHIFKIEALTNDEYKEIEVPLNFVKPEKGQNSWNGARHRHLDVQQLPSGGWVAVMDGDRVSDGDLVRRFIIGYASIIGAAFLIVLMGVLLGLVNCIFPLNWIVHSSGKRNVSFMAWERSNLFLIRFSSRVNRALTSIRVKIKHSTCARRLLLTVIFAMAVGLVCHGVKNIYGGNGSEAPYPWKGQYSQFTLLTMTYDARLWNLKMYVKHYSRCSSVREIVVVWNKGVPPKLSDMDSAVPLKIRVEERNSLNNRFKVDPSIETRAVLELDDDIMMTCDDVERGFNVWRQHPDRIVGFYPRFINMDSLKYRPERYARLHKGYNMILTGAAFIDSQEAFKRYWGEEAKLGRDLVDKYFNCEDVLLNYLYANASSLSSRTVEYVRPAWAIDTSKFSGAAISKNTKVHYQFRSNCLVKFSQMYGSLGPKAEFNSRKDGWDL